MPPPGPPRRGRQISVSKTLTTADLVVLSLLAERSMHGYELLKEYERQEVADWTSVSKAQVYYALQKLAGMNLIEPVLSEDGSAERERTVFVPTVAGLESLAKALAETHWARARVPQPFTTWLGLSIHLEMNAAANVIEARRRFLQQELARERRSLDFIETLDSARAKAGAKIVRLVIRQIEAELKWLEEES